MSRLHILRTCLGQSKATHLLLSNPVTIRYVTGFHSSNAFVLIDQNNAILITDFRYEESAQQFCRSHTDYSMHIITEGGYGFLKKLIPEGQTIGLQSDVVTLRQLELIKKAAPKQHFIACDLPAFTEKTVQEIQSAQQATIIAEKALEKTLADIGQGITEKQLCWQLLKNCGDLGSSGPSFDPIVLFGQRSSLPHGKPSDTPLRAGDFILIDFGCLVDGICSDMTRTFVYKKASARQKQIYDVVLQAQQASLAAIEVEKPAASVDAAARSIIEAAGYGKEFGHATGHGVGYEIHEAPRISKVDSTKLAKGMIITIEPGIYLPGFGGVRIEDMVVVSDSGYTNLNSFPKKLQELQ